MKCLNISHPKIKEYLDIVSSESALSKILDLFPDDYFPSTEQIIEEWNKNFIENLQNIGVLSKTRFLVEGEQVYISIPLEFREQNATIGRFPIPASKDYKMLDELERIIITENKDWVEIKESEKSLFVVIPKKFYRPSSPIKLRKALKINDVIDLDNNLHPFKTEEEIQNTKELFTEPYTSSGSNLPKIVFNTQQKLNKGKDLIDRCKGI